jgi:predicted nucleotidyltransferase component of viral defense system
MTKNMAVSVRQRLLNLSRETGERFQNLLTRYGIERLVYRLTQSRHSADFILKGANLFYVWTGQLHRPTRDLDLLRFGDPEPSAVAEVFAEVCQTEVIDDGIDYDVESITADFIREDEVYAGVRVKLTADLAGAVIHIQVDVGIGDEVYPDADQVEFPTLLDLPTPSIRAYQFETAIAEKLEAMVKLGMSNSRMKDFYDVYVLARDFEFDGTVLQASIRRTFEKRETPFHEGVPVAWTDEFSEDDAKIKQWRAFLRKSQLDALPLADVVAEVRTFLEPVWVAIQAESEFTATWRGGRWE